MKRFFSLMLVALLLVSALPFAAFATDTCNIRMELHLDGTKIDEDILSVNCAGAPFGDADIQAWGPYTKFAEYFNNTDKYTYVGGGATTDAVVEGWVTQAKFVSVVTTPACDHADAKLTLKSDTASCGENGIKTYVCECGETVTKDSAATGKHAYVNGACKYCGASDGIARSTVVFYNNKAQKMITEIYTDKVAITVPTGELIANYEFRGWWSGENGSGTQLTSGHVWNAEKDDTTWYAWYVYNPNKDGVSNITITARCYIDNVGNSYRDVHVLTQSLPDNTNVFDWLSANKNTTILDAVYSQVDTSKYEWKNRYFYNYNGSEVLTSQSTFADGPKAILIKLEAKDNTTRANVQLYLHKNSTTADPFRILDMNGYTSGMNVTRDEAINLIKKYYTYKSVGNLFTESDWNALQNGENVSGRTTVHLTDNGTYKIHVVVTNANSKSGTADSSNPKTGDYITVAVTTMVLAAAAVITLAEMKKRKMI